EVPIDREAGDALLAAIEGVVRRGLGEDPASGELVVGLPLNMDGSEGPRAAPVRAFAGRIGARTRRRVHPADDRITNVVDRWRMARTGLTRKQKKERKDALAAAAILEAFLAERSPGRASSPGASTENS